MDWNKEYEKIGNKPVRQLTSEDRMVCFKPSLWYLMLKTRV